MLDAVAAGGGDVDGDGAGAGGASAGDVDERGADSVDYARWLQTERVTVGREYARVSKHPKDCEKVFFGRMDGDTGGTFRDNC